MTDIQKQITIYVTIALLCIVVIFLGWLVVATLSGTIGANEWPGRGYLLLLDSSDGLRVIFKSVFLILTVGATLISATGAPKFGIYFGSSLALLGAIFCFVLFLMIPDHHVADKLWAPSDIGNLTSYSALRNSNSLFLGSAIAWFGGYLCALLGVIIKK